MKITKSSKKIKEFEKLTTIATTGCEKCPECGKVSTRIPTYRTWYNLFKGRMRIICYKCDNCGCEYESEPHRYC